MSFPQNSKEAIHNYIMNNYNEAVEQANSDLLNIVAQKMKDEHKPYLKIASTTGLSLEQIEKLAA